LNRIFARLLNNKIQTLTPTFVEIYLKMTNLYRFHDENPHFEVLRIIASSYYHYHYRICTDTVMVMVNIRYSFKFKLASTILPTE